ncbi:hypothetical protein STEG23_025343, partial [Scotinomys teguina]
MVLLTSDLSSLSSVPFIVKGCTSEEAEERLEEPEAVAECRNSIFPAQQGSCKYELIVCKSISHVYMDLGNDQLP